MHLCQESVHQCTVGVWVYVLMSLSGGLLIDECRRFIILDVVASAHITTLCRLFAVLGASTIQCTQRNYEKNILAG